MVGETEEGAEVPDAEEKPLFPVRARPELYKEIPDLPDMFQASGS
jgi:hypothetical protein